MKIFLRLFLFIAITIQLLAAAEAAQKPYVLVISFDGFRWDYPDRGLTPNIDQLARDGVRALSFEPVFPSKTFPNHFSIVTGLYPQNHGLINNRFENPFTKEMYRVGDTVSVRNAKWYRGEPLWETAKRQGVRSASFFWPGSEMNLNYRRPAYFKRYDGSVTHEARIQGIIDWLQLPENLRPHLLFLYFSDTDTQGHRFGPDSPQINEAITLLDEKLGLLRRKLAEIGMAGKVNIILLSDHGMTQLKADGLILLHKILGNRKIKISGYGPLVQFRTSGQKEKAELFNLLEKNQKGYTVYLKEDFPAHFHYQHNAFIGDIIAVADLGYSFIRSEKELQKVLKRKPQGDHGYDNHAMDMHGIFFAAGPAFKKHYRCGTLHNIDVYPLVCRILGITPNQKIDGLLERISPVLK